MSPLFEHANFAPGLTSHRIWLNSSHLANIQPRLLQLTVAPAVGPRLLQRLCLKGTTKVIDGVTWRVRLRVRLPRLLPPVQSSSNLDKNRRAFPCEDNKVSLFRFGGSVSGTASISTGTTTTVVEANAKSKPQLTCSLQKSISFSTKGVLVHSFSIQLFPHDSRGCCFEQAHILCIFVCILRYLIYTPV